MSLSYPGKELELFEKATNWKRYFSSQLNPYVKGDVIEVGAGIGGTTSYLVNKQVTSWTCLEPDLELFDRLKSTAKTWDFSFPVSLQNGTLDPSHKQVDCILYIDVLEHIEKDQEELEKAFGCLKPEGYVVILVPAFNSLYSPFDASIGHFRRYDKRMIRAILPPNGKVLKLSYLDSMGFFSSVANKLILGQAYPKPTQISLWDKVFIPFSRILDPLIFFCFGKTLIAVIKK